MSWGKLVHRSVGIDGSEKTEDVELSQNPFTIGRSPSSSLVINEVMVSNNHCSITHKKGVDGQVEYVLADTSSNGTFIDEQKIGKGKSRVITDGAKIAISIKGKHKKHYFKFLPNKDADPSSLAAMATASRTPKVNEIAQLKEKYDRHTDQIKQDYEKKLKELKESHELDTSKLKRDLEECKQSALTLEQKLKQKETEASDLQKKLVKLEMEHKSICLGHNQQMKEKMDEIASITEQNKQNERKLEEMEQGKIRQDERIETLQREIEGSKKSAQDQAELKLHAAIVERNAQFSEIRNHADKIRSLLSDGSLLETIASTAITTFQQELNAKLKQYREETVLNKLRTLLDSVPSVGNSGGASDENDEGEADDRPFEVTQDTAHGDDVGQTQDITDESEMTQQHQQQTLPATLNFNDHDHNDGEEEEPHDDNSSKPTPTGPTLSLKLTQPPESNHSKSDDINEDEGEDKDEEGEDTKSSKRKTRTRAGTGSKQKRAKKMQVANSLENNDDESSSSEMDY